MTSQDEIMMTILYSPVHYTHSSHYPDDFLDPKIWDDVLMNFWLLHHFVLENLPDGHAPIDNALLAHWYQLPDICYLIGGYLLRNQLLLQKTMLMTDPCLLRFISLPLRHHIKITGETDTSNTMLYGAAFVLGLFPNLPTALVQRFKLVFPATMKLPQLKVSLTLDHFNLFHMALTYAQNKQ